MLLLKLRTTVTFYIIRYTSSNRMYNRSLSIELFLLCEYSVVRSVPTRISTEV